MEDRLPFASGQPLTDEERPQRTLDDALRGVAEAIRSKRNRRYKRPPTEAELAIDRRRHPWNYD